VGIYSLCTMFFIRLQGFVGSEYRISWSQGRNPRKEPTVAVSEPPSPPPSATQERLFPAKESAPSPLVNGFDSEEARPVGVSGFGGIPKPTSFGLNARRQIKRLSACLDEIAGSSEKVIFFTGTLPGSTTDSMLALSQWSGFVIHRLKAWLHDVSGGYSSVFCWEWQKRGALHLHMAVYVKCESKRNLIYNGFKKKWISLLEYCSDKSGVDLFKRSGGRGTWRGCFDKIRARAEWVKKSVGAYLGKYLSKAIGPGKDKSKFFYPSRWWGSTQDLKDYEKSKRTEVEYSYLYAGDAERVYIDIQPHLELFADWSTSYGHKFVRGGTTVAYGIGAERFREITRWFLPMKDIRDTKTLKEVLKEAVALWQLLIFEEPKWMERVGGVAPVVLEFNQLLSEGALSIGDSDYDEFAMIFHCFYFLKDACNKDSRYGGRSLPYRYAASVRSTFSRLESAVLDWEYKRMEHSLQDVHYPGRLAD
jgi:hypothetical protein